MSHTTLISAPQLQALIASDTPLMVFDSSFDLAAPAAGHGQYLQAHIPGAVYVHLDQHLSAAADDTPASGGRHPLPSRERFAQWLASIGFSNDMQAVVYDRNGSAFSGRLWWMLQWAGHAAVAVLDGGWAAWQAAGGAVTQGEEPARAPAPFTLHTPLCRLATVDTVLAGLGQATQTLVDARAPARYRGEVEPMDPVAGHIPGALNRPFTDNLTAEGYFKNAQTLRDEWQALLGECAPQDVTHHCGSGVTAIPNVLAMELAGFGKTTLFAGSWSEWCRDPARPVARG